MKRLLILIVILLMSAAQVQAAKIDAYQQILASGRYTIRYENLTPAPRVTNRNVVELYGKNGLIIETNVVFLNRPISGVIVGDGDNRYEEVGYKGFFQCRLVKGGDNFIFTHYPVTGGGVEYFGEKKGKVAANPRNYLVELLSGESFGDATFTEMMNATELKKYQFVASGETTAGMAYEDFSYRDGATVSAIRYYFDGDTLKKIAFATATDGKLRKCIVRIVEFSSAPVQSLLSLPSGLVDTTKR